MPWYNAVTGEHVYSPSDSNINKDELVYRPSIYAKEELPTWSEVYEEFYLGKQYSYDSRNPEDNNNFDLYWKVPHKKYLIAIVCNQFNKMIFEDNLKDQIIEEINKQLGFNILNLQFTIYPLHCHYIVLDPDKQPAIYSIKMPNGSNNPFMLTKYNRIDISDFNSMDLNAIIEIDDGDGVHTIRYGNGDEFNTIIEVMIKPFKDYFTGEIGWKDSEGNLIEGDPSCRNCTGAGYCTT